MRRSSSGRQAVEILTWAIAASTCSHHPCSLEAAPLENTRQPHAASTSLHASSHTFTQAGPRLGPRTPSYALTSSRRRVGRPLEAGEGRPPSQPADACTRRPVSSGWGKSGVRSSTARVRLVSGWCNIASSNLPTDEVRQLQAFSASSSLWQLVLEVYWLLIPCWRVPTYEGAPRVHENAKRGDARLPARARKRCGYGKNGINRPPPHFNGKEGVDGSSPSEGFRDVAPGDSYAVTPPPAPSRR